jgi:hypothetical protein
VQDAAWLWPLPSVTSVSLAGRSLLAATLSTGTALDSYRVFPPLPLSSPSPVINNLISIAACYERHDFSLALYTLAVLTPISSLRLLRLNSRLSIRPRPSPATRLRVRSSPQTPCESTLHSVQSSAVRYCLLKITRIPEATLEDKRLVLGVGCRRRL